MSWLHSILPFVSGVGGIISGACIQSFWGRRTELRNRINEVVQNIENVCGDAELYWCSTYTPSKKKPLESRLKHKVREIAADLTNLDRSFRAFKALDVERMKRFRQAVTGGTFEQADQRPDANRYNDILHEAIKLKIAVRNGQSWSL